MEENNLSLKNLKILHILVKENLPQNFVYSLSEAELTN